MEPRNHLRRALDAGEPSIGTHIHTPSPILTEIAGRIDTYDYVEFLGEYAPYDLHDLDHLARTAELVDASTMLKIDEHSREYLAQRALSAGIQNILFTNIRSVEDAERAIAAVRPEPEGDNGVRMDRRLGYVGSRSAEDVVERGTETVVAFMIEKAEAVDDLEAILSVEGLDMVQFGAGDYSVSIGRPGEHDIDPVTTAERETIETALEMGVAPRAEIRTAEGAVEYLEMGVRHFCMGWETVTLHDFLTEQGKRLEEMVR
jgi:2-keto-3-deoxy-L-rhamnonate aldolase RhmA